MLNQFSFRQFGHSSTRPRRKIFALDKAIEIDAREPLLRSPVHKSLPPLHLNRAFSDTLGHFIEQSERIGVGNEVAAPKALQRSEHLIGDAA
jgi:hypothetical protein